jgi:hypothetical protein
MFSTCKLVLSQYCGDISFVATCTFPQLTCHFMTLMKVSVLSFRLLGKYCYLQMHVFCAGGVQLSKAFCVIWRWKNDPGRETHAFAINKQ